MLHGHEFILHGLGLLLRRGKRGVHVGADIEAIRLPAHFHPGQLVHFRPGGGLQTLHRHIHFPQQLRNQSALLLQQCQKQMHLFQLLVGILNRQLLGALDSLQRLLRIVIEVHLPYLPFVFSTPASRVLIHLSLLYPFFSKSQGPRVRCYKMFIFGTVHKTQPLYSTRLIFI